MSPRDPKRERATAHSQGLALLGFLPCVLLLAGGCDSPAPVFDRSVSAPAPAASVASVADPSQPPDLAPLPRSGTASLALADGRITLLANRVPAAELLEQLREILRFELAVAQGVVLPRALTLRLSDAGVDMALEQILSGLPYAVFYAVDSDDQHRVLARVLVGELPEGEVALSAQQPRPTPERPLSDRIARGPAPTPEEQRASYEQNQDMWYDELFDPDPETRAYAVDAIYLDDQTFPILADLLSNDPDPQVRVAAASTLGSELDNPSAADALLIGLQDANVEVVIEALDALEDVGDASNIRDIQPLLLHPNSEVREAALDAIEWLED